MKIIWPLDRNRFAVYICFFFPDFRISNHSEVSLQACYNFINIWWLLDTTAIREVPSNIQYLVDC